MVFPDHVTRTLVCTASLVLSAIGLSAQILPQIANDPFWCSPNSGPTWTGPLPEQPASTRRMAERLRQICRDADPLRNPLRGGEQVALLRKIEKTAPGLEQRVEVKKEIVQHLLNAGYPLESIQENESIRELIRKNNGQIDPTMQATFLMRDAVAYLRLAEQENCQLNHNADSCLLPISGGGVHIRTHGSENAIRSLTQVLELTPGDLRAQWLLNIAYMTLGGYPEEVPSQWLIDPKIFEAEYDIKRFPDVAGVMGVAVNDLAGGVVLEDFDNDGLLDLAVSASGLNSQLRIYRNTGDGKFEDRTISSLVMGLVGGLNMIHTDYNNDGFADLLVLRGGWLRTEGNYPNSLLRNNGDFTFTDVTEEAGLRSARPTQTAVWLDYNGDGWLDLYVANESPGRISNPNELYRNNGNGTFTECAKECGLDLVAFYKGVTSADYNRDGRPDLFLSRQNGPKLLFRNDGPGAGGTWKFTQVAEESGIVDPPSSFPCWFWDFDNDGWDDIMVTGYSIQDAGEIAADYLGRPHAGQRAYLYRNQGNGTFKDVSHAAHINRLLHTMGCNFGDLDNDGWLDFYSGTGDPDLSTLIPNRMFRNNAGVFQDVTTSGGFGQIQKGHGIAFGDIDNDGDQDIYSVLGGALEADYYPNQLFANPGHGNQWLKLKLEGVTTNRAAVGARIHVVVTTPAGPRSIHRTVGTGASFGSSTFRQEIGLADATQIERVEIFWPVTGQTQTFTGLQPNRAYRIREGKPEAENLNLPTFTIKVADVSHGMHAAE